MSVGSAAASGTTAARRGAAGAPPRDPRAGLLAIDKPAGLTSHAVVARVARHLRIARAGHLGTLDPGATGLLLVATGAATRCVPVWQGGDKTYEATLRFGVVTTTQDLEGEVIERSDHVPDERAVREATPAFVGEIQQLPPMVSAIRVGGERLHALARRGLDVERPTRTIHVRRWDWLGFDGAAARFRVVCSSGTYVRTLAHDLGAVLGAGAALESLRRLRSEPFGLERAMPLAEIEAAPAAEVWTRAGSTIEEALAHLPALVLDARAEAELGYGGRPERPAAACAGIPVGAGPRSVVFRSADARVLALGELRADGASPGTLLACPHVVFPWAVREGKSA